MTVVNKNVIHEEIRSRLNLSNVFYHSIQNLLFSHVLSKSVTVGIYKNTVLPVVLCGCETWSLTLFEEHRLTVFENRVLRIIFGSKRDYVTGGWRKLYNNLYSSRSIIGMMKSRRMR
jgi:hypothetical protein